MQQISVDRLIPYINNSRTHSDEQVTQIAASIKEFGFTNPLLIDESDGIIAGHGRLLAAKKLSIDTVPCLILSHLSEAQKKAYIIADNKLALNAGWDDELLSIELIDLKEMDFDLDLIGFDAAELDVLMGGEVEGLTDADAVPEVPEEPISKRGDVWLLGNHRVLCGDSTSVDDVEKLMDGNADLLFTSPPYANMRDYNGNKELSVENVSDFIVSFFGFTENMVINLGMKRIDGEVDPYWNVYIEKAKNIGYKFLSWNVWSREGMGGSIANMSAMFRVEHEWLFVFGKNTKELNATKKNKSSGLHTGISNRQKDGTTKKAKPKIVKEYGRLSTIIKMCYGNSKEHPAVFPVELPAEYITAMTSTDDTVIDPFGGSGSTLIACEKTNRNCRMMELDEKYCDVIVKRWQDFTGKEAVLESTGDLFGRQKAE